MARGPVAGCRPGRGRRRGAALLARLVSRLDGIRSPSALTAWLVTTTKREAWRLNRRRQTPIDPTTMVDVEADLPTRHPG